MLRSLAKLIQGPRNTRREDIMTQNKNQKPDKDKSRTPDKDRSRSSEQQPRKDSPQKSGIKDTKEQRASQGKRA